MSRPVDDAAAAPCPTWCDYRDNHLDEWDGVETSTGLLIRNHEAASLPPADAPVWAYVYAEERSFPEGRRLSPPMVAAGVNEWQDGELLTGLTVEQTRAFAQLLLAAADRAEALGAPVTPRVPS